MSANTYHLGVGVHGGPDFTGEPMKNPQAPKPLDVLLAECSNLLRGWADKEMPDLIDSREYLLFLKFRMRADELMTEIIERLCEADRLVFRPVEKRRELVRSVMQRLEDSIQPFRDGGMMLPQLKEQPPWTMEAERDGSWKNVNESLLKDEHAKNFLAAQIQFKEAMRGAAVYLAGLAKAVKKPAARQKNWQPPRDFVGTNEICNDKRFFKKYKNPPPTTLQQWFERSGRAGKEPKRVECPATGEKYYPEQWIMDQIAVWNPRKERT